MVKKSTYTIFSDIDNGFKTVSTERGHCALLLLYRTEKEVTKVPEDVLEIEEKDF